MTGVPEVIGDVVEKCEAYAEERFDGEEYYTQITKWQDGDFTVEVRHGMKHQREPYRQRSQRIFYRHHDGVIVYADCSDHIDRHRKEIHEQEELERIEKGESSR